MKRWQDILGQSPDEKHEARVLSAVEQELAENRRLNRRQVWRKSLFVFVPTGAMAALAVVLWKKSPMQQPDADMDLLAFAENEGLETADLEWVEDFELLEDLEDLEAWDEKPEA